MIISRILLSRFSKLNNFLSNWSQKSFTIRIWYLFNTCKRTLFWQKKKTKKNNKALICKINLAIFSKLPFRIWRCPVRSRIRKSTAKTTNQICSKSQAGEFWVTVVSMCTYFSHLANLYLRSREIYSLKLIKTF